MHVVNEKARLFCENSRFCEEKGTFFAQHGCYFHNFPNFFNFSNLICVVNLVESLQARIKIKLDNPVPLAPFDRGLDFRTRHGRTHEPLAELVGGQGALFWAKRQQT